MTAEINSIADYADFTDWGAQAASLLVSAASRNELSFWVITAFRIIPGPPGKWDYRLST